MARTKSIESIYYTVPNFEGLSIKDRVKLLETSLPAPKDVNEAFSRAKTGLYAIGKMSCMLIEQLSEDQEYSDKSDLQYWSDIAIECESSFQGNINSVLLHKTQHYQKIAKKFIQDTLWKQICTFLTTEEQNTLKYDIEYDELMHGDALIARYKEILNECKVIKAYDTVLVELLTKF